MGAVTRIAVVSDVHGNLTAYRAVLEDAERRGADLVLNLGDVAGKGPRGSECVALTRERCAVTVAGNWEVVLSDDSRRLTHPGMQWWRAQLSEDDRAWMRALPLAHHLRLSGRWVRFVHASTDSPFTRIWRHHSQQEFDSFFEQTPLTERDGPSPTPDVVVYGDLHHVYSEVIGGRTLINCGSSGNPLDEDPQVAYLLLEGELDADGPGGSAAPFSWQQVRLPHDVDAEVAAARAAAMPLTQEYEVELRTGVYRSLHVERGLRPPPPER